MAIEERVNQVCFQKMTQVTNFEPQDIHILKTLQFQIINFYMLSHEQTDVISINHNEQMPLVSNMSMFCFYIMQEKCTAKLKYNSYCTKTNKIYVLEREKVKHGQIKGTC